MPATEFGYNHNHGIFGPERLNDDRPNAIVRRMEDWTDIAIRPIDAVREPGLRAVYDYWNSIRDGRPFALRKHFDPAEIPQLLKDLLYMDVERQGDSARPRFRYRVVGTGIADFVGDDYTGRTVDEVFPEPARAIMQYCYTAPLMLERPVYSATVLRFPARRNSQVISRLISRLIMPMSRDGERIDQLLNGQSYDWEPGERLDWSGVGDYELLDIFAIEPDLG